MRTLKSVILNLKMLDVSNASLPPVNAPDYLVVGLPFLSFNGPVSTYFSSFFGLLYYFSIELQTDVIYRFMEEFVASRTAWLACFFVLASLWTIDHMLHSIRLFLAYQFGPSDEQFDLVEEEAKLGRRKHTL